MFRPSYGGNRNYTLIYTLGELMVSADDDMRPYSLMEHSPESLEPGEQPAEVQSLSRVDDRAYKSVTYDILGCPAGPYLAF